MGYEVPIEIFENKDKKYQNHAFWLYFGLNVLHKTINLRNEDNDFSIDRRIALMKKFSGQFFLWYADQQKNYYLHFLSFNKTFSNQKLWSVIDQKCK